jgi:hypothetical protein
MSLFEQFNDMLAIYTNTVAYALQLSANSDALEDSPPPTKRPC